MHKSMFQLLTLISFDYEDRIGKLNTELELKDKVLKQYHYQVNHPWTGNQETWEGEEDEGKWGGGGGGGRWSI